MAEIEAKLRDAMAAAVAGARPPADVMALVRSRTRAVGARSYPAAAGPGPLPLAWACCAGVLQLLGYRRCGAGASASPLAPRPSACASGARRI
jgi:hypothetical protein